MAAEADSSRLTRTPARLPARTLLLIPAALALLAGLTAALLLLDLPGVTAPRAAGTLSDVHGPLMVLGFLGTLIALERAVAARRTWPYAAPAFLGLGALATIPEASRPVGQLLTLAGALGLIATYVVLWQRQRDDAVLVELLAAGYAALAAATYPRLDVAAVLPWLAGFVVFTIAAERVELARLHIAHGERRLLAHAAAYTLAASLAMLWPALGGRLVALVLLALTLWLAQADVARRTIRSTGQPRYAALALLLGYAWLAIAALTWFASGTLAGGAAYDTVVHGIFLGFAMSMVLAHAPVILPAVVRRPVAFRPILWGPLALLHTGLLIRLALGNGLTDTPVWRIGATVTILALLALPLAILTAARHPVTNPRKA
ncbi:MAG: hypothetical protein V9G19_15765 [Tetrasphaera sp.]